MTTPKKVYKTKWYKIVHNFMDSNKTCMKLYEPYGTYNSVTGLKHYLDGKMLPIGYTARKDCIYIFRTDIPNVTIEATMAGNY